MARSKSVKSGLREWLAIEKPAVITGEIWRELLERFAPVSESYLRELLRDAGVRVEQPWGGVRQHTLEELEGSLGELLDLYERAVAGGDRELARYCRRVVIGAKDRAKFSLAKGNEGKREMVDWMMVWLENVGVWREWVRVRKQVLGEASLQHGDTEGTEDARRKI